MNQFMQYNRIPITRTQKVELLSRKSEEWKNYKDNIIQNQGKTDAQKERLQKIENNQKQFQRFKKDFDQAIQEKGKVKNLVKKYRQHLKQASFSTEGRNKYGNKRLSTPASYDKYNIIQKLNWHDTHVDYKREQDKIIFDKSAEKQVKEKLEEHGYDIVEKEDFYPSEKFSVPKNYRKSEKRKRIDSLDLSKFDKEKIRRKELLRFLWHKHLSDIEDYDTNRAEAYLRDLNSKHAEEKNNSNRQAFKYEKKIRDSFKDLGLEKKRRILKIEMQNGKTRYKELDGHFEYKSGSLVVEIYTNRDRKDKKRQLRNYVSLLRQATSHKVQGILVEQGVNFKPDSYYSDKEDALETVSTTDIENQLNTDSFPILKITKDFEVENR